MADSPSRSRWLPVGALVDGGAVLATPAVLPCRTVGTGPGPVALARAVGVEVALPPRALLGQPPECRVDALPVASAGGLIPAGLSAQQLLGGRSRYRRA